MTIIAKMAAAASIALLTTSGAFAAAHAGIEGPLDADGDGMLTEEEFEPIAALGAQFTAYDSDGDGMLSEEEYNEGVRSIVEPDGNGSSLNPDQARTLDELTALFSNAAD